MTKKFLNIHLTIAKFGAAHGILGWIRVFSYTEKKENIFDYVPWFIKKEQKIIKILPKYWKILKKTFLVKINDVNNRSMAQKLTNYDILINQKTLPKLNNNEYYWKDIVDCTVFDTNFIKLGRVSELIRTPSNDILVVKASNIKNISQNDMLIPFLHPQIISEVNINNKKIVIKNWKQTFE
ncbi:16S rRNA processing protein rimM [Buchnera aphidicola str. Bp (Baizongia pistaciae)]|uniref:Ribosome maturation factor RimM n=1 Tax=Buchnera aphidicola subsp. Baizongia pistaciae (strain Bp) TaxID=224915 RepID=RIMM_BUCBP|nr:ribosome maturation factor RimM [Buchnera aphidicola]P59425.1 RecName: Full=Ribosome maturation factor RimM [Buchnera aphidicola str. Bp (Baizongia pistaciae)]AAO27077.1 16S rRNA processing protein rimM [Buchnera aphidicola str. Bp (Baizongia pistaciae)]